MVLKLGDNVFPAFEKVVSYLENSFLGIDFDKWNWRCAFSDVSDEYEYIYLNLIYAGTSSEGKIHGQNCINITFDIVAT